MSLLGKPSGRGAFSPVAGVEAASEEAEEAGAEEAGWEAAAELLDAEDPQPTRDRVITAASAKADTFLYMLFPP